jgi:hypothetical protein
MTTKAEVTMDKLRQLCNDALNDKISDEEFFRRSLEFFVPAKKVRAKKPKPKKARRGLGSY